MGKEFTTIQSSHNTKRQRFDKAFKLHAISLLQSGHKPPTQLALELGIRRNQLYKWAEALAKHHGDADAAFNGPGRAKLGKQHDPLKAENARRELLGSE